MNGTIKLKKALCTLLAALMLCSLCGCSAGGAVTARDAEQAAEPDMSRFLVAIEDEFMILRKGGKLACYTARWMADFNDPGNFIYTFFGDREKTVFRSLCYPKEEIMERMRHARTFADAEARLAEYRELERVIVQEDAARIPLYSRQRVYVTSERLEGIRASWNGSVKNRYRDMAIAG